LWSSAGTPAELVLSIHFLLTALSAKEVAGCGVGLLLQRCPGEDGFGSNILTRVRAGQQNLSSQSFGKMAAGPEGHVPDEFRRDC